MTNKFEVGDLVLLCSNDGFDGAVAINLIAEHGYGIVVGLKPSEPAGKCLKVAWFGKAVKCGSFFEAAITYQTRFHQHATPEAIIEFEKNKKDWLEHQTLP